MYGAKALDWKRVFTAFTVNICLIQKNNPYTLQVATVKTLLVETVIEVQLSLHRQC